MTQTAEATGNPKVRRSLAILLWCAGVAGCSSDNWKDVTPHFYPGNSPTKITWRNLTPPSLSSIFVSSDGRSFWAVGDGGTILHTADGEHWKLQESGTENLLQAIYGASDGKLLWAVGIRGTILHSTDGEHWNLQKSGTENDLQAIYGASDGKSLWAMGSDGVIVHSTDGEHWNVQKSGITYDMLSSICGASDGRSLWAVSDGNTILHSADGEHWAPMKGGGFDVFWTLNSIYCTGDGGSFWAVGRNGTILHSADGKHLAVQKSGSEEKLTSIYGTRNGKSLWAVGDDGTILHSADGAHWIAQISGTTDDLNSIHGTSDGKSLWAVGRDGTILHSSDGEKWVTLTNGTRNSLNSIYGTSDGKSLWAVGNFGTILHTTDGENWKLQESGTKRNLQAIYGASDGKSLWAVGFETILHSTDGEHWTAVSNPLWNDLSGIYGISDGGSWTVGGGGAILHSTDGEHWTAQTSGTTEYLYSIYGSIDGKSLWVVGSSGTILHSTDGEHWAAEMSGTSESLRYIYGSGDGKSLWAVGDNGTILHSADGAHWIAQISNITDYLISIHGTSDGKSLWAVSRNGTILHSTDGEHWIDQPGGTRYGLNSIYATSIGSSLWAVGDSGTILEASPGEQYPYIAQAQIARHGLAVQLEFRTVCPDARNSDVGLHDVLGRNQPRFEHNDPGTSILPTRTISHKCSLEATQIDPDVIDVRPGQNAYFDIAFLASGIERKYEFDAVYDPWYWFRENWPWLVGISFVLSLLSIFTSFLYVQPLWNIKIYRTLKLAQIDKLSIPGVGPTLQVALKTFTVLPWFVIHTRTLDAWVNAHRKDIEKGWGLDTRFDNARSQDPASSVYVPLPIRIADENSGPTIQEPSATEIGALFDSKRSLFVIVGAGGAGKTTLAQQIGRWALESGRPGGFPGHPMMPVWVDEDLDSREHSLINLVKGKLAATLPEEDVEGDILNALLRKQRIVVIVDRLSERSSETLEQIKTIYRSAYRSARIEALVITTRIKMRPHGSDPIYLYPRPLDASNLLRFMLVLLEDQAQRVRGQVQPEEELNSAPPKAALSSPEYQLAVGEYLTGLFRSAGDVDGSKTAILPLPVRLFVEESIRLLNIGHSLDELPATLPDVYFRYLERVNPADSTVKNFMTNDDFLRASMALAKLALGEDFIPKEFFKDEARETLRAHGWTDPVKLDPIQRMLDNGILLEKTVIGHSRLRFVLDPVAENLAASAYVRQCDGDVQCLDELTRKAAISAGFRSAVELARRALGV